MSTERTFDLNAQYHFIDNREENLRMQAWMNANGIRPNSVPQESLVFVKDDSIEYTAFKYGTEGEKILDLTSDVTGYVKVDRRVPLISAPENFNL